MFEPPATGPVTPADRSGPGGDEIAVAVERAAPKVRPEVGSELAAIFLAMEPGGSLAARLDTIVALATWLRDPAPLDLPDHATVGDGSGAGRVWLLVEVLRDAPRWAGALAHLVTGVVVESSALRLLARTGLPSELRFFSEFVDRLVGRLLPRPPEHDCLAALTARLFPDARSMHWLDAAPPSLLAELVTLLIPDGAPAVEDVTDLAGAARRRLHGEAGEALALLAVRAASLGLDEDIRSRSAVPHVGNLPLLALARTTASYLDARRAAQAGDPGGEAEAQRLRDEAVAHVASGRVVLERVATHLDVGGVSVDLVFRVELLGRLLERVDNLLTLLDTQPPDAARLRAHTVRFFRDLVAQAIADRSFLVLVQQNSRLLARRIIERAGETGEHYITASRTEWHAMLRSAAGGGFITAGTTVVKFWLAAAHLPYFFQGAFAGLNYAGSFVALQFLGFTLATKQPSMTAAALAANIQQSGRGGLDSLVELIARTLRSQLAALIGNLGMVVPAALAVHSIAVAWTGSPFLDADTAAYVVTSHHPLKSGSLFYAALTGVFLWLSSILGGWLENWSALHRLPEAIAGHPSLLRWVGAGRARLLSRGFVLHVSGIGSNVSLGFLLGAAPIVGKFFGAPVDVRHVTLSTASLALAGASVGPFRVVEPAFREALAGIGLIGLLNFSVSFSLALLVALRARNVPASALLGLFRAVIVRFLRYPMSFLYPPKDPPKEGIAAGGH
ncbi:MAG: gliding motility protein [Pseudomonadota bacterium]|nr:gliding motility protein [Pseudomonadota bacterium]